VTDEELQTFRKEAESIANIQKTIRANAELIPKREASYRNYLQQCTNLNVCRPSSCVSFSFFNFVFSSFSFSLAHS
jgi:hypothetical protein